MTLLHITVAAGKQGPVVKLSGESDVTTVGRLRDVLNSQISGGARYLTVDVSELRFADSASIGALLRAHRALRDRGGGLELAFPQPTVARVLSLLGADQILTVRTHAGCGPAGPEPDASLRDDYRRRAVVDAGNRVVCRTPAMEAAMALDQAFDADTLHELRKAVLVEATAAGMPDDRAVEVMIAVHELAANAVRHGAGAGRLRIRVAAGELCCQVSDAGSASADGDARRSGTVPARSWPVRPGCGLWLVREIADHLSMASGLGGSQVTAVFTLPGFRGGAAGYQSG